MPRPETVCIASYRRILLCCVSSDEARLDRHPFRKQHRPEICAEGISVFAPYSEGCDTAFAPYAFHRGHQTVSSKDRGMWLMVEREVLTHVLSVWVRRHEGRGLSPWLFDVEPPCQAALLSTPSNQHPSTFAYIHRRTREWIAHLHGRSPSESYRRPRERGKQGLEDSELRSE